MSLDYFDAIFYINLDHRKDRKENLIQQLEKLNVKKDKIFRIPAVLDPLNGARGCIISHINALDLAIEKNLSNVLILEDDCEFAQSRTTINYLLDYFFKTVINWDVFFLGCGPKIKEKTKYKGVDRIIQAYLSHAYAINKHYFEILKRCYERGFTSLEKIPIYNRNYDTTLDREWHSLQKRDKWYMLEKIIAIQANSRSDIDNMEKKMIFH